MIILLQETGQIWVYCSLARKMAILRETFSKTFEVLICKTLLRNTFFVAPIPFVSIISGQWAGSDNQAVMRWQWARTDMKKSLKSPTPSSSSDPNWSALPVNLKQIQRQTYVSRCISLPGFYSSRQSSTCLACLVYCLLPSLTKPSRMGPPIQGSKAKKGWSHYSCLAGLDRVSRQAGFYFLTRCLDDINIISMKN